FGIELGNCSGQVFLLGCTVSNYHDFIELALIFLKRHVDPASSIHGYLLCGIANECEHEHGVVRYSRQSILSVYIGGSPYLCTFYPDAHSRKTHSPGFANLSCHRRLGKKTRRSGCKKEQQK